MSKLFIRVFFVTILLGLAHHGLADGIGDDRPFELKADVLYAQRGERQLKVDIYMPRKDGKHAAVLVVHGGAWRYGDRRQLRHYGRQLARRGYVAYAIDYRLAPKHKFPAQIEDCRDAVRWIRTHADEYNTDPERIGAVGYSAGGHLVSLLATTGEDDANGVSTRVQAVAAGGAPTEFRYMPDGGKGLAYWLGGTLDEKQEVYRDASPAAFATEDDAPVYFYNGDEDKVVPVIWTQPLHIALREAGVDVELYTVTGADHMRAAADNQALEGAWKFFDRHLQAEQEQSAIGGN